MSRGKDAGSEAELDAAAPAPDAAAPVARAPWLIKSGDAVFFVGNSFFGGDNDRLADLVTSVGAGLSTPFSIRTGQHVVHGNHPLSWFFQQSESQNAIASQRYKMFVVQGEEREPVEHKADFQRAVRDYQRAIAANGGGMMLFMTWDFYSDRDTSFFAELSATYEALGEELNVPVIPVGLIYDDCNEHPYRNEQSYWLTSRELHQNEKGTAVNTYATFAMLTGIDPMGQPYSARNGVSNPTELREYLSDMAWARVSPILVAAGTC